MKNISEEKILEYLMDKAKHPLRIKELLRKLNLKSSDRVKLRKILKDLAKKGLIIQLKGKKFAHPKKTEFITGILKKHPDGYGFVIPESSGEKDLFIYKKGFLDALHGDKVIARVEGKKPDGRIAGSIIKILERENKLIVGKFEKLSGANYIFPDNPRLIEEIIIPDGEAYDAKNGQICVTKITQYPEGRYKKVFGKIIRVLGFPGDDEVEFLSTVYNFELPFEFPNDVEKQARKVVSYPAEIDLSNRKDLRDKTIFTIDGEDAKDFDDAVSIEKNKEGFTLGVHIADVANYVKEKSAIDKEALTRGTSVYFPNRVIPMLPFDLSNNICSLKPEEDRLTISVEINYNSDAEIKSFSIFESIIKSKYRMTYDDVLEIITGKNPELEKKYEDIKPDLMNMKKLASLLNDKRKARNSLDFDLPEPFVIFNEKGEPLDIIKKVQNQANNLIEEFMLQANEVVAKFLTLKGFNTLYRIHEVPDNDSLDELHKFLKTIGIKTKKEDDNAKWLKSIVKSAENHRLKHIISHSILRLMKKALYSPEDKGHFGLALEKYTHFTSPIRRYPDLIIHRLLKIIFQKFGQIINQKFENITQNENIDENQIFASSRLKRIAEQSSSTEIRADEAERDVIALKRAQFMLDKIGNEYEGIIISILPFGFFVEILDFYIEGFVPVSSLENDYYEFNETGKYFSGKHTSKQFKLGDLIKVNVSSVDIQRRKITFIIPALLEKRSSEKKSKKRKYFKVNKKSKRR